MAKPRKDDDSTDHYPDSFWLGKNEDPMIAMLDFLEAGGSWDQLPTEPPLKKKEKALGEE